MPRSPRHTRHALRAAVLRALAQHELWGGTKADADRVRTGCRPPDGIQRNEREPDARSVVCPSGRTTPRAGRGGGGGGRGLALTSRQYTVQPHLPALFAFLKGIHSGRP
eukprot:gene17321-biopygen23337